MPDPFLLHIDDDRFFARIYARRFKREHIRAKSVSRAEDAWRSLEEERPNVILLDVIVPDQPGESDGFQILSRLKHDQATSDIPVIMLSDLGGKDDIEHCLRLGAAEYLVKAHHGIDDTLTCVRRWLSVSAFVLTPGPA